MRPWSYAEISNRRPRRKRRFLNFNPLLSLFAPVRDADFGGHIQALTLPGSESLSIYREHKEKKRPD
jgi:hypothetical protein